MSLTVIYAKGITYTADAGGITSEATGSGPGSQAMAKAAQSALSSCPDTKLILTGYSQGAMVVHNSAKLLGSQVSSVVAGVTFGDPFKTLFISRLSYEATESDLSKEFGVYGPIERIRLVRDKEGKSRGYAFIIYAFWKFLYWTL